MAATFEILRTLGAQQSCVEVFFVDAICRYVELGFGIVRWTPNSGQPEGPVFVMVLPRPGPRRPRSGRPRRGSDNRATDEGDPRHRTGSRPSGPTPAH